MAAGPAEGVGGLVLKDGEESGGEGDSLVGKELRLVNTMQF